MKSIVYMMCGLPGSGKTSYSIKLQKKLHIPRLSLDEEYFKAVDNTQQERRDFALEKEIEESLKLRIVELMKGGKSVILDYGFWKKNTREVYRKLIVAQGGERKLFYFKISKEQLLKRLAQRNIKQHSDFQYITPIMLEDFYKHFEEPSGEGEEIIVPLK